MSKRKIYYLLAFLLILIIGVLFARKVYEQNKAMGSSYNTISEYNDSIDYSCRRNSDCAAKDVHNCCGKYNRCVNKNAKTDPIFVENACRKEGIGSICKADQIKGCKCVNKKCESE